VTSEVPELLYVDVATPLLVPPTDDAVQWTIDQALVMLQVAARHLHTVSVEGES
jgi:hypothetical protein